MNELSDMPPRAPDGEMASAAIRAEARTRVAGALGLTALTLVMVAPCACGATLPVGGILGAGAAIAGIRARNEEPSAAGRAWAQTGIGTGGLAAALTLLVALIAVGMLIAQVMGTISAVEAIQGMIP